MAISELKGLPGLSAWLVYNKVIFNLLFLRRFNFKRNDREVLIIALQQCKTLEEYKEVADRLGAPDESIIHYTFPQALEAFKESNDDDRKSMLLEALICVDLTDEERTRLISLHTDDNGISYGKSNISNVSAGVLVEMIIESLLECSKVDCDFALMSKQDLDAVGKQRVDIRDEANSIISNAPETKTKDLLPIALKNILSRIRG